MESKNFPNHDEKSERFSFWGYFSGYFDFSVYVKFIDIGKLVYQFNGLHPTIYIFQYRPILS